MRWFGGRRPSADERLDAELRDHFERRVSDHVARGMTKVDARRQARLELGGLDQAKEACRDVRPFRWLDEFTRDVRLVFADLGAIGSSQSRSRPSSRSASARA